VGRVTVANRFGFEVGLGMRPYVRYGNPHSLLLDRSKYLRLKPFVHHGAPCLANMKAAERAGWDVEDFPVQHYFRHAGRGTCSRFGYGLSALTLVQYFLSAYLPRRFAQWRSREHGT
jgi:hypothetical protein